MTDNNSWEGLKLETPANYRIRVQGHVDSDWSKCLGGMTVKRETSTIQGHLQDQAALSGVLNALYDLHLPLLNVECIDEPKT
jgi:hypothetical protein